MYLYICLFNIKRIFLGEHVYSLQYAELFRVNAVFFFVFLSLSFVFVYLSYCPGRACVFATVGGVVVSNEQRKLLSHPVVILNTSDFLYLYLCARIRLYVHLYLCLRIYTHTSHPVAI